MGTRGGNTKHGKSPAVVGRDHQREAREDPARRSGMAERPVVPSKPGNAGGGKGPRFKGQRKKKCAEGRVVMNLARIAHHELATESTGHEAVGKEDTEVGEDHHGLYFAA